MADVPVRTEERLKIKIGEAKQLLPRSNISSVVRDVYCTLSLDQEEIYRTKTVEKTLNPFFGEEFQFEVPRPFRFLSIYVFDRDKHLKQNKVLGKVAIKREELASYNNKDHWFSLRPVDADSEVQGKANIELQFTSNFPKNKPFTLSNYNRRLLVQVLKCFDLTLKNGACDPYALACVTYTNGKRVSKRTKVRKKTTSPLFDEVLTFDTYEGRDKDSLSSDGEVDICELNVSIWHDAPGMAGDVFLGEVRVQLSGIQQQNAAPKNAWYYLQPRSTKNRPSFSYSTPPGTRLSKDNSLGSLRLQVQYNEDRVFPAEIYEPLKNLLLKSVEDTKPITSSAVFFLGEIVSSKMEIAQPLVRIFMHHGQIVPIIKALANAEISILTDPTTIFRGNTLVSKMMDEAMRLIGLQYLHKTLRPTIELIFNERKPCEIDPTRVRDSNTIQTNLNNLKGYVLKVFEAITQSAVHCPSLMCQIFHNLKECAMKRFPQNKEVTYSVISGFIFLRFFAPAILGPRLFDLTNEQIDNPVNRTLTLISKTIQSLGNLVSYKTQQVYKEGYMEGLYKEFYTEEHVDAVKKFLEIISATSNPQPAENRTPVTLKEGLMIKRAQGRKRFGRKNFKQRYFKLTTHSLSYSKSRGRDALCEIPLQNIWAVERLTEKSFKMKNMFQIVQPERTLYVQAANCVEEKEWVDLLTKICQTNRQRLYKYHPSAFINGQWSCCKSANELAPGCCNVSSNDSNNFHMTLDPERELQRIHSLTMAHMNQLEIMMCQRKALLSGTFQLKGCGDENIDLINSQYFKDCCRVLKHLKDAVEDIENKHKAYMRSVARETKYGSLAAPIGDDNYLLASRMNLDSSLLRR